MLKTFEFNTSAEKKYLLKVLLMNYLYSRDRKNPEGIAEIEKILDGVVDTSHIPGVQGSGGLQILYDTTCMAMIASLTEEELAAWKPNKAVAELTEETNKKLDKARVLLFMRCTFYGRQVSAIDPSIVYSVEMDTMATNGAAIYVSPFFVLGMALTSIAGVLAHEILHIRFRHCLQKYKNHDLANVLQDLIINHILVNRTEAFSGKDTLKSMGVEDLTLPPGCIPEKDDTYFDGEEISSAFLYNECQKQIDAAKLVDPNAEKVVVKLGKYELPINLKGGNGSSGGGNGSSGGGNGDSGSGKGKGKSTGTSQDATPEDGSPSDVKPAGSETDEMEQKYGVGSASKTEQDIKTKKMSNGKDNMEDLAANLKKTMSAGASVGCLKGEIAVVQKKKVDWLGFVRTWLTMMLSKDRSYSRIDRRSGSLGILLPDVAKEVGNASEILFCIDVSGSVWCDKKLRDGIISDVLSINKILGAHKDTKMNLVLWDCGIQEIALTNSDVNRVISGGLIGDVSGGGGTDPNCIFEKIGKKRLSKMKGALILTDGYIKPLDKKWLALTSKIKWVVYDYPEFKSSIGTTLMLKSDDFRKEGSI